MATGRKGPSAPPRKRASAPVVTAPDDDDADGHDHDHGHSHGPDSDDLVAVVRGLAAAVADHGLTELIVDTPDVTFTLRRGTATVSMPMTSMHSLAGGMGGGMPSMSSMQIPSMHSMGHSMGSIPIPTIPTGPAAGHSGVIHVPPVPPPAVEEKVHVVTSPFVGTFYRRPNPDAAEYVKINDKVTKGAVLCLVEAMKLMNEIESDVAGTVVGVLAEDGAPVEYGQPLFKIAPA